MENLPSRPQRLPAGLHAWLQSRGPHLPPAEPNGLAHTHSRLCGLGPGEGQLVPGWPNRPAAHLVWVRGGAGAQADGAGRGPGNPGGLLCREKQTREGEHCPRPHSTEEENAPHLSLRLGAGDSPVPKMSSSVTGLPQMYPLGPRFMLKLGLCHLQASSWAQRWATLSL